MQTVFFMRLREFDFNQDKLELIAAKLTALVGLPYRGIVSKPIPDDKVEVSINVDEKATLTQIRGLEDAQKAFFIGVDFMR